MTQSVKIQFVQFLEIHQEIDPNIRDSLTPSYIEFHQRIGAEAGEILNRLVRDVSESRETEDPNPVPLEEFTDTRISQMDATKQRTDFDIRLVIPDQVTEEPVSYPRASIQGQFSDVVRNGRGSGFGEV